MYKDEADALLSKLRSKTDSGRGRSSKFDSLVKHIEALSGNNVLRIEPLSVTDVTNLRGYVARNVRGGKRLKIQSRRMRGSDAKKFRVYVSRT
jgi:hypothetical protein